MDKMRSWAIYNSECPKEIFDESVMCDDCPNGCPLAYPDDPRNIEHKERNRNYD